MRELIRDQTAQDFQGGSIRSDLVVLPTRDRLWFHIEQRSQLVSVHLLTHPLAKLGTLCDKVTKLYGSCETLA